MGIRCSLYGPEKNDDELYEEKKQPRPVGDAHQGQKILENRMIPTTDLFGKCFIQPCACFGARNRQRSIVSSLLRE